MAQREVRLRPLPRLRQQRLPRRRRHGRHQRLDAVISTPRSAGSRRSRPASIFAIARLLDAVASPLIGYISDHFHHTWLGRKFGRRRFFILLAVPLLPSFALMWVDGQTYWYYLVTYVFFELVYAMEIIPYETLAAEMSPDYRAKAKFAGARILCGQIVRHPRASGLPARHRSRAARTPRETFFYMGVIFSVIFMLVALAVFTVHLGTAARAKSRASPPTTRSRRCAV